MTSPCTSSELTDLLPSVRASARRSLAFLAQRVLGLQIEDGRCARLQEDPRRCAPLTHDEVKALKVFHALRRGEEPAELSPLERMLVA